MELGPKEEAKINTAASDQAYDIRYIFGGTQHESRPSPESILIRDLHFQAVGDVRLQRKPQTEPIPSRI